MNELTQTVSMIVGTLCLVDSHCRMDSPPSTIPGADVGHSAPGICKPSTVALVYNLNQFATKYGAITQLQDPRQEIIGDLETMMKAAMKDLMGIARNPLKNIVFFRDGVSEGEYDAVKVVEVKAITCGFCFYRSNAHI